MCLLDIAIEKSLTLVVELCIMLFSVDYQH